MLDGQVAERLELSRGAVSAGQQPRRRATRLGDLACVLSGHGDFLARRMLARVADVVDVTDVVPLADRLGCDAARAATAYALAVLLGEERP